MNIDPYVDIDDLYELKKQMDVEKYNQLHLQAPKTLRSQPQRRKQELCRCTPLACSQ